jgi:hypothetical protein
VPVIRNPAFRPEAWEATPSASRTRGRCPERVSQYAVERPTMPAPTTTVSTSSGACPRESQRDGALTDEDTAAVHVEDLARDVLGEGGSEEEDGARDVVRSRDAA